MNAETLSSAFEAGRDNRAIRLLADTTYVVRADPGFLAHEDDVAAAVFLADEAPAPLAVDALNLVLSRIDDGEALEAKAKAAGRSTRRFAAEVAALPSPVREAALDAMGADQRWKFAGVGIHRLPLLSDQGAQAVLMRIEPGHGVAEHDHEGDELTLVLTGAYNDGDASYGPGDVSLARPGFVHTPRAEPGDVCYVLLAFRGAPKFKGPFGLAQRAIGYPTPLTGKGG
jgi:putative transcriptional regulator